MFVKSCFYETVQNLRPINERFCGEILLGTAQFST